MLKKRSNAERAMQPVTLRTVAEHVGLAPCSVSAILNNSAAGMSIPQQTKDRVWSAARRLNYRPNYSARALRTRRTYTVAMLMPDIGYAPAARIAAGAEDFLRENDYCLIITSYERSADWQQNQFAQLRQRGVEGVIAVEADLPLPGGFPTSSIELPPAGSVYPMTSSTRDALTILGRKAAVQVVGQIEGAGARFRGISAAELLAAQSATLKEGTARGLAS